MSEYIEPGSSSNYPIETPDDPRFTYRLVGDVGRALVANGYPPPTGEDVLDLQKALHEFLYEKEFAGRDWRVRATCTSDSEGDAEGRPWVSTMTA